MFIYIATISLLFILNCTASSHFPDNPIHASMGFRGLNGDVSDDPLYNDPANLHTTISGADRPFENETVSSGDVQSSLKSPSDEALDGSIEVLSQELAWFQIELEKALNEEFALSDQARRSLEIIEYLRLYDSVIAEQPSSIFVLPSESVMINQFLGKSVSQRLSLSLDEFLADFHGVFLTASPLVVSEVKRRLQDDLLEEKNLREMHLEKIENVIAVLMANIVRTHSEVDKLLVQGRGYI